MPRSTSMLQVTCVPAPSALSLKTCLAGLPPCPKSTFAATFSYRLTRGDDLAAGTEGLRVPNPAQFRADARTRSFFCVPGLGIGIEPRRPLVELGEAVQHGEDRRLWRGNRGRTLDAHVSGQHECRRDRGDQQHADPEHDPPDPTHGTLHDGRQAAIQSAYLKSGTVPRHGVEGGLSPGRGRKGDCPPVCPPLRNCTGGRS